MTIKDNLKIVYEKIDDAAKRSGRNGDDITLVAVSKRHSENDIKTVVSAGVTHLGESRVQEAESKVESLGQIARWHLIGHLQTNKASKAVRIFDMIESVDSAKLARKIDDAAHNFGRKIDCLIEINSSGERSKFGLNPDETGPIFEQLAEFKNILWRGIMTIGPYIDNETEIRHAFALTRNIFVDAKTVFGESFNVLSMGMSADYELAIEEGSTLVRVGTAIFGPRAV